MNIIMNMTIEKFEESINNNSLPEIKRPPNTDFNKNRLFRDTNDFSSTFVEWAYHRRNRLKYQTIDELFESSPFSYAFVDKSLESRSNYPELYDTEYKKKLEEIVLKEKEDEIQWYIEDGNKLLDYLNDGTVKPMVMHELLEIMYNRECKFCGKNKQINKIKNVFCSNKCYDDYIRYEYYDDSS